MKHLLSLGLTFCLALPAQANIFGLFGSDKIDCDVRDRACLLQAATDMTYAYGKAREIEQNKGFVATLARIYWLLPEAERPDFIARFKDFDASDPADLMFDFTDLQERYQPVTSVDLATLEQVLQTETTPDGSKFGDFILNGFTSAFADGYNRDAYNLWMRESKIIWSKGQRTYRYLQRWLALNEPQEFNLHTQYKNIAGRHRKEVWENMGLIVRQHCALGNTEDGRAVLNPVLQQFEDLSPEDLVIRTYAKSYLYKAILECEDEATAQAFFDEVMEMRAQSVEFVKQQYTDPGELAFVLGAVHDTIEFQTHRVLALKLHEEGKVDEARKVFEEGQATVGVFGTTITEDGEVAITPSTNRAPMRWETFIYDAEQQARYEHGSIAIPYFMDTFEFDVNERFFDRDAFEDFIEAIGDVWPSELGQKAAARIVEISNDLKTAKPENYAHFPDKTLIELGLYPQPPECTYSDETLQGMLDRIGGYKYRDQMQFFLVQYVKYLDRSAAAKPTDGGGLCLLDQT